MAQTQETVLEIDLKALTHNYKLLTSKINPQVKIMGVVKAFGYGSDAIAVAKTLAALGVDYFAVAYAKEGVALRDAGIETPILVLHPQPPNFKTLIDRCLEPALYSARVLKTFISIAVQKKQRNYPVHIKFNTGLNRLGFSENDITYITNSIAENDTVKVKSLFSHLAASEDFAEEEFTKLQIETFKNISEKMIAKLGYQPLLHQSNTSAILNFPEAHFSMVRTGIGLYGYGNDEKYNLQLQPVVQLKSIISQIHEIAPDESVGYNRTYRASGYEKTATIPIGHADGISRQLGQGKGAVLIQNKRAPIIGNVCMDMLMVNVTGIECEEGDEVVIIGDQQSASELAQSMNSISYELLTALSQRIKRRIVS